MSQADNLRQLQELRALRQRRMEACLSAATDLERKRAMIAASGRTEHETAVITARTYVKDRFAEGAESGLHPAHLFVSLSTGHDKARRDAQLLGSRAQRLTQRHEDAVRDRDEASQALRWAIAQQEGVEEVFEEILADALREEQAREDEEIMDIFSGRGRR